MLWDGTCREVLASMGWNGVRRDDSSSSARNVSLRLFSDVTILQVLRVHADSCEQQLAARPKLRNAVC